MKIIYVTGNCEYVQPQIIRSLNRKDSIFATIFLYDAHKSNRIRNFDEGIYYQLNSILRGPVLLLSRLRNVAKYLESIVKKENIDILHGNMSFSDGAICRFIYKNTGIPYVISFRDADLNQWFWWKIPWLTRAAMDTLLDAKKIIFLSEAYKMALLNKVPLSVRTKIIRKCIVIPNGIDKFFLDNLYTRDNDERNINKLIFIGAINKRKNLETVIDSISVLNDRGNDFVLTVIGQIKDKEYEKIIKNASFVEYVGKCNKEEIMSYLRDSHIFILPSHTESFGLVYAEAMSQGLPVIYTRGQGFDNGLKDGIIGYAVSDTSVTEICNAIIGIVNSYYDISANCTKYAQVYNWDNITDQFVEVYRGK